MLSLKAALVLWCCVVVEGRGVWLTDPPPTAPPCLPADAPALSITSPLLRRQEDPHLQHLFIDLGDLHHYVSNVTRRVTVSADTVVMGRESASALPRVDVTILARRVHLEASSSGGGEGDKPRHAGDVGGVRVAEYQTGSLRVLVLGSGEACSRPSCSPPHPLPPVLLPDYTLHLMMTCALALGESRVTGRVHEAISMTHLVMSLTMQRDSSPGHARLNTEASHTLASLTSSSTTMVVAAPRLSQAVYSRMSESLSDILDERRRADREFKEELELLGVRLEDTTNSVEFRKRSLETTLRANSRALETARRFREGRKTMLIELQNKYSISLDHARMLYKMYKDARANVPAARDRLVKDIEKKRRDEIARAVLSFLGMIVGLVFGLVTAVATGNVVAGVAAVTGFASGAYGKSVEIQMNISTLDGLISNLEKIMERLPVVAPSVEAPYHSWEAAHASVLPLTGSFVNQTIGRYEWDSVGRFTTAVLRSDYLQGLGGTSRFETTMRNTSTWAEATGEQARVLCELLLDLLELFAADQESRLAVDLQEQELDETRDWLDRTKGRLQNYTEELGRRGSMLITSLQQQYISWRSDALLAHMFLREYCHAYHYQFLSPCPHNVQPSHQDSAEQLAAKIRRLNIVSLTSLSFFTPRPHSFDVDIVIRDECSQCSQMLPPSCPVERLRTTGNTVLRLADWWPDFYSFDRVRIRSMMVVLEGLKEGYVSLTVSSPALLNDTYRGQTYSFSATPNVCAITYTTKNGVDVQVQTRCESSQNFQDDFMLPTPYGLYQIAIVKGSRFTASHVTGIRVNLQGSVIPGNGKIPEELSAKCGGQVLHALTSTTCLALLVALVHLLG